MDLNYIEITDVTGKTWRSDVAAEEWTTDEREQITDIISHFDDLTHLKIEIGGEAHFFNAAHLVCIAIKSEHKA